MSDLRIWKVRTVVGTTSSSWPQLEYFEDQDRMETYVLEKAIEMMANPNARHRAEGPDGIRMRIWFRWFIRKKDEEARCKSVDVQELVDDQWEERPFIVNAPSLTWTE